MRILDHDRHINIYHAKSRLNTPVWGSLRSPNYNIYVIVINQMRGLYAIYKSRDTRAKPKWQGFMNRVQTERWFITVLYIARKYCVLSRYVANNYIIDFPANTFFNDAYQTISDIQFIATDRVGPATGYKYIYYIPPPLTVHFSMTRSVRYQPILHTLLLLHATH